MALVMAAAVGWTAEIQVKTTAGLVKGTTTEDRRIRVYKGIPFGAPPVGELRWQAPRPAAAWPGVREATEFGSRCMQGPIFSDIVFTNKSEDCLNLNLWTPAQNSDAVESPCGGEGRGQEARTGTLTAARNGR